MISGATAQRITLDVGNGTPWTDSELEYGPEELEFRARVEREFAEIRDRHPTAVLHVVE